MRNYSTPLTIVTIPGPIIFVHFRSSHLTFLDRLEGHVNIISAIGALRVAVNSRR